MDEIMDVLDTGGLIGTLTHADVVEMFNKYDINHDHVIDEEEFISMMKQSFLEDNQRSRKRLISSQPSKIDAIF